MPSPFVTPSLNIGSPLHCPLTAKGTSYSDLALLAVRTAENADAVTHFFSDYVMKQAGVLVVNGTVKVRVCTPTFSWFFIDLHHSTQPSCTCRLPS